MVEKVCERGDVDNPAWSDLSDGIPFVRSRWYAVYGERPFGSAGHPTHERA